MSPAASSSSPPQPRWQPLTGGTAIWIFMGVEVFTFGMFLLGHAWGWRSAPQVYAESQALLHPASGVRGTFLLLLGSGLAYLGLLSHRGGQQRVSSAWMAGAAVAGLGFCVNKMLEYADPALAAVNLSTNSFWFVYLFLTGIHLLHVFGGVLVLLWLAWRARHPTGPASDLAVEAGAAYWHLVDLIWVLLFPIVYLMHP
jgi:nitric oxide reductase NorE protein